jgi:LuxR family maltose regulon positive regulatory protein
LLVALADLLRERNDLAAALRHATEGAARLTHWNTVDVQLTSALVLARIKQAQGDLQGALAVVQQAGSLHTAASACTNRGFPESICDKGALAQNDLAVVLRWLEEQGLDGDPPLFSSSPLVFVYGYEHSRIVRARVLIAQGLAAAERRLLEEMLVWLPPQQEAAAATGLPWLRIKAYLLQALGDRERAIAVLKLALVLAEPEGCVGVFVDEGPPMAALL